MDTKMKMRLARAKRTAFGRFLCRLVGDTAGAVMMEYVVLGVLVVAAVVGLVVAFGGTLGSAFKTMSTAIFNPGEKTTQAADDGRSERDEGIKQGDEERKSVTGQ